MTVQTLYSGFDSLQANRYGLGATKKTATRYMWSVAAVSDTSYTRLDKIPYAYPNLTRRQVPEAGTDNVTAGSAGVIDTAMKYINIQIGEHEINSHMTIEQFGGVPINHIVRSGRVVESNFGEDFDYITMEDGNYTASWLHRR